MGITNIPQIFYKITHSFSELSRTKLQEFDNKIILIEWKIRIILVKNHNTWSHWEWINGFFLWDNGSLGPSIFSGKLGWKWHRKIGRETTLRYYTVYSYRRPTTKKETVHWWSHSEAFRCVWLSADSVRLWIWRLRCGLLVLLVWSD